MAPGEWYHCYTRGIDKRTTFENRSDYERFQESLYLSNSDINIERGRIQNLAHKEILEVERGNPLVAVGAYCLMPNHFHLLLKEIKDSGIAKFMQKVGTSYTMYFNTKRKRTGSLFVGPFRSRHIVDDRYLSRLVPYIHLNPVELFEPGWKDGIVKNMQKLEEKIYEYPYSSLLDYKKATRNEKRIIDPRELAELLKEKMPPLKKLLPEMHAYYQDLNF